MSHTPAERIVLHHCVDEDGFVVTLHCTAYSDPEAYRVLVQAIREYRDAIRESATMDRKVAGSLYGLLGELENQASNLRQQPHPRLDARLIADALAECWELVQDVFWL